MPSRTFEPCVPARAVKVPAGPDWIHEIKHDGYRVIVHSMSDEALAAALVAKMAELGLTGPGDTKH